MALKNIIDMSEKEKISELALMLGAKDIIERRIYELMVDLYAGEMAKEEESASI